MDPLSSPRSGTYNHPDVRTGEHLRVDRIWQARRAKLTEYPVYLQERWWTGPRGAARHWDTMAPGGAGWLLSGRQVENWVCTAVCAASSEDRSSPTRASSRGHGGRSDAD
jgi:hypothetical protein